MRGKPTGLDISLINESTKKCNRNSDEHTSPMGTTYRVEGLSIGRDYMRFEGATLSSALSPSALRIEKTVGRGACSVVKLARHASSKEPLALKIFPIRDHARREMLVKELRALCSLQCDCLVSLVGAFFDMKDGCVTMVLEFMDRGSLEDVLLKKFPLDQKSPLSSSHMSRGRNIISERTVSSIAFQMLWGLSYLHYEKMSHRDIKPANVLINSAGQIKLSDFGIASSKKKGEEDMNLTVIGTTRYMSPERLRAKPYGTSSDIWSLGLVLIECASGKSPFDGISSVVELVQTIEDCKVEEFVPSFMSEGLREILTACLQKLPKKRVPADVLISSPWFESHEIYEVSDSVRALREFIEETYETQNPDYLSFAAIDCIRDSPPDTHSYGNLFA